jgi:hypothetical protein
MSNNEWFGGVRRWPRDLADSESPTPTHLYMRHSDRPSFFSTNHTNTSLDFSPLFHTQATKPH